MFSFILLVSTLLFYKILPYEDHYSFVNEYLLERDVVNEYYTQFFIFTKKKKNILLVTNLTLQFIPMVTNMATFHLI